MEQALRRIKMKYEDLSVMSGFIHTRAIMYPITKETLEKMNLESPYDLEENFPKTEFGKFCIEGMVAYKSDYIYSYYVSLELCNTYGIEDYEFGRSRFLTEKEQEKYVSLFEQIIPDLDPSKLKYVEFCFYNCCECQDYYVQQDEFYEEV